MFFSDWWALWRIFLIGSISYFSLIFWLRLSGKRTLSKWNAFDFIVTIAFGSVFATVIISKDVALSEGIFAVVLLIALQFIITWLSVRVKWISRLVKGNPTLLYFKDDFLSDAMRKVRVPKAEILSAVRSAGFGSLSEIKAVVLETDGSFSVVNNLGEYPYSALSDVENLDKLSLNLSSETDL